MSATHRCTFDTDSIKDHTGSDIFGLGLLMVSVAAFAYSPVSFACMTTTLSKVGSAVRMSHDTGAINSTTVVLIIVPAVGLDTSIRLCGSK